MLASSDKSSLHAPTQTTRLPSIADHFKKGVLGFGRNAPQGKPGATNNRQSSNSNVNGFVKDSRAAAVGTKSNGIPPRPHNIALVDALTASNPGTLTDCGSPADSHKHIMLGKGSDTMSQDGDANSCGSCNNRRQISEEELAILQKIEAQYRVLSSMDSALEPSRKNQPYSLHFCQAY